MSKVYHFFELDCESHQSNVLADIDGQSLLQNKDGIQRIGLSIQVCAGLRCYSFKICSFISFVYRLIFHATFLLIVSEHRLLVAKVQSVRRVCSMVGNDRNSMRRFQKFCKHLLINFFQELLLFY